MASSSLFTLIIFGSTFLFFVLVSVPELAMAETTKNINIGVILDMNNNSRIGIEQKIAMQIAVQDFKNKNQSVSIHFLDFNGSSLQTAFAAQALIKEKQVEVILVGLESWQTTALVATIGSQAKVPILSLAASPPITSAYTSLQWPFLIQMSHNATQQITNITAIIENYHWRRVTVVYEDDPTASGSGGNSGLITLLNEGLKKIGSEIECNLVLPSHLVLQSTMDLEYNVNKSIEKLLVTEKCYSRVFIVLKVSIPYLSRFFEGAKGKGLFGNDSIWITTEAIGDLLPSLDDTTRLNMEGVLSFMSEFDNSTSAYSQFQAEFGIAFVQNYGDKEVYNEPSFHALLAYDAITAVVAAISRSDNGSNSKDFLREILRRNFTGLTGLIYFDQDRHVREGPYPTMLVNIVGTSYSQVLDFNHVTWPGNYESDGGRGGGRGRGRIPKGWAMPTNANKLKIGIPLAHNYTNFVGYQGVDTQTQSYNCPPSNKSVTTVNNELFTGFCIELFEKVRELLDYCLPYEFIPHSHSYDDLILRVRDKVFDGTAGDMTILANRTKLVDFTFPYQESGLSIILPTSESYNSNGAWIFLQPFTTKMWFITVAVFVYTMFIIWVLEHGENSEFRGSWKYQINATLWFACNSLYFAQRERISNKLARVVVIMWLFLVLVLTTSYTANLTSMLTNERLNQTTVDAEMLKRTNAKVGYDNSSFVKIFLENLLQFDKHNIIGVNGSFEALHESFQTHTITAAFIEVVYARLFVNKYCNQYIMTTPVYRYGGLGFAFPKGSPIAVDVSEAILKLTESGAVTDLETKWLNTSTTCAGCINEDQTTSLSNNGDQTSLSLKSFRVPLITSLATTTLCLLASFIPSCKSKWRRLIQTQNMVNSIDNSNNSNPPIIEIQMY